MYVVDVDEESVRRRKWLIQCHVIVQPVRSSSEAAMLHAADVPVVGIALTAAAT